MIGRNGTVYSLDPGGTSESLTKLGITTDDTVETVYQKLISGSSATGVFYIYCGYSQSVFKDSLPEKSGAIIEFIKFNSRGCIKCTHFDSGKSYSAGYNEGITEWV